MDQKIMKFNDIEIDEYKFHQNKSPISINNIDIKILKKLNLYAYSILKWLHAKEILMKKELSSF